MKVIKENAIVAAIVLSFMIPLTLLVFVPAFQSIGEMDRAERAFEEANDCQVTSIVGGSPFGGDGYYTIVWEKNGEEFITLKMRDSGKEITWEATK